MATRLTKNYKPTKSEPFMNAKQREYFRRKLVTWKEDILRENRESVSNLQEENVNHPDITDRASSESEKALELRTRNRHRKLVNKIDAALERIENKTYGICRVTGKLITKKRLELVPHATLSIEAKNKMS